MLFSDLITEVYVAFSANKIRSGLTMLGIIIGIASVIAMVSVGQGAQRSIEESIESIGSNLLIIRPGSAMSPGQSVSQGQGSAESLTMEDAEAITSEIDTVESVAPTVMGNYQVVVSGENMRTSIVGTTPEYIIARNISIKKGAFFTETHNTRLSKVAVLGPDVVETIFPQLTNTEVVGKKIRINGIDFTVLGVTEAKGGSGVDSVDDIVYVPILTAIQYLTGGEALSVINVTVSEQGYMDATSEKIKTLLLSRHGIADANDADFRIMNQLDIVETASSVTETFTFLLGSVAGISLVVGGIGIMNMMLTTVTERTREIGLRKAVGAKRYDINRQFLLESIAITFLGGIIGVFLGWGIAWTFTIFGGIATSVSGSSILLAFGVSTAIGILFGYYPARRASRLNPIEALRYE
jgi:putative ABC transport system permease protein